MLCKLVASVLKALQIFTNASVGAARSILVGLAVWRSDIALHRLNLKYV